MSIGFRNVSSGTINGTGQNLRCAIPSDVVGGDGLLALVDISSSATVDTPAGFVLRKKITTADTTNTFYVFSKVSTGSDAGVQQQFVTSSPVPRGACLIAAYSGTDPGDPISEITGSAFGSNSTDHQLNTIQIVTDVAGCWLVEAMGSKGDSAGNPVTAITRTGLNLRATALSGATTGQNSREVAIADDATANTLGATIGGGAAWHEDVATANFAGCVIALAPASGVQTVRLVTDVTVANWTPSVTLPSGLSKVSLLGDGADGTYLTSPQGPTAEILRGTLGPMTDPGAGQSLTIKVRLRDISAASASHTVYLYQGGSPVYTSSAETNVHTSWADLTFTVPGATVDTIDFSQPIDVRISVTAAS